MTVGTKTEQVTSAAALLVSLPKGTDEKVRKAAELVRDEAADRNRQIKGYRALLVETLAFLYSIRLEGKPLERKQRMVGMIAECEDGGDRMDCAMLVQAAEVGALMSGKSPAPQRGNVRRFPGRSPA